MSQKSAKTEASHTPELSAVVSVASPAEVLDLTALRMPQNFGAVSGVKKLINTVPVRKPGSQSFVRVHPGADWTMAALILQLKDEAECYFVLPNLAADLAQEVRVKQLYTYVNRDGHIALWPVNLPGDDGRIDQWSQSAHAAADLARRNWVRVVANRYVGAYDVFQAANASDEPFWPELSFREVLNLAFKDRLITSLDHPVVKRLRGEI